ncbi:MAG: hypothetical protein Q9159_003164 [Coniocarpon cinnabarinum]
MAPPRTLERKVAVVTGASRGIGTTLAYDLASRGAKVAITYTSESSKAGIEEVTKRIASETASTSHIIQADLREPAAADKVVEETVKAFGFVDILVNNAGLILTKTVHDVTPEDFDSIYHLNVRAPLLLVQKVWPHMRRPGRIINISSVGARANFPGTSVYASSKTALEGLTRCWASELGGDGTTVNAVGVGPVESVSILVEDNPAALMSFSDHIAQDMLAQVDPSIVDMQKATTPVKKRVGTAQDIADIVAFLAEERSRWVSGQCISASGGYACY